MGLTRWLVVPAFILGFVTASTPAALAHAEMVATSPADGESVADPPHEVVVSFNEPVTASAVRVFDAGGIRVDDGVIEGSGTPNLRTLLGVDLGAGWYVVAWSAISVDDHPIRGAFVFEVGSGGAALDDELIASIVGGGDGRTVAAAGLATRWLTYVGWLVAVGGSVMALALRPGRARAAVTRLVTIAAVVGITGSVLSVLVHAADVTGLGLSVLASPDAVMEAAGGVGRAALAPRRRSSGACARGAGQLLHMGGVAGGCRYRGHNPPHRAHHHHRPTVVGDGLSLRPRGGGGGLDRGTCLSAGGDLGVAN